MKVGDLVRLTHTDNTHGLVLEYYGGTGLYLILLNNGKINRCSPSILELISEN